MDKAGKNWSLGHENKIDDDQIVFIPIEEIRAIERVYIKMIQAQREFCIAMENTHTDN